MPWAACAAGSRCSAAATVAAPVGPFLPPLPAALNPPLLPGRSARTKRIAGIKSLDIYAVGLYVDQGAAHSALHRTFGGAASAAALATDQRLFDGEAHLLGRV